MLKDGSDSVGVMGALNRVYLNIGTFSEEWLLHFNALVGGKPISPIEIKVAESWTLPELEAVYGTLTTAGNHPTPDLRYYRVAPVATSSAGEVNAKFGTSATEHD